MPAIPTPPADASGGILLIQYNTPIKTHRLRLHVAPFNYPATPQFQYNPVVGGGTETTVQSTFLAFAGKIAPFFANTASINLLSVFQIVGGVPVERFGWAPPGPVAGSGGAAPATTQLEAMYTSFNFKSVLGGRAKIVLIGGNFGAGASELAPIDFSALGGAALALLNYLISAASGAVCHDGNKFAAVGKQTFGVNKRLRRTYGFS